MRNFRLTIFGCSCLTIMAAAAAHATLDAIEEEATDPSAISNGDISAITSCLFGRTD